MISIRRAPGQDAAAVAHLFRKVRTQCLPYLPDLHPPEEDLWFFANRVFRECEVWVAATDAIVGFCAFREGWIDHLLHQAGA